VDLSIIDTALLQIWMAEAMAARHAISTGRREVSLSVAHPQSSRSVTYNQANLLDLRQWIADLTSELGRRGIGRGPRRRAIGLRF
jgi:hypothetical protein